MRGLNCVTSRDYAAWDKIILSCTFQPLLQAIEWAKLWIMHCTLPHSPRGWCFPKSCILHSTPLFLSLRALWSFPFCSFSFICLPTSLLHTAILFRQGSEVKSWWSPLRQKSSSEDSTAVNSYFCDNSWWCQQPPGVNIQSDAFKSPADLKVWQFFLKRTSWKKKIHVEFCLRHNIRSGGNNKRQHKDTHRNATNTVFG